MIEFKRNYLLGVFAVTTFIAVAAIMTLSSASSSASSKIPSKGKSPAPINQDGSSAKNDVTKYDKWNLVCSKPDNSGEKNCRLVQKVLDEKNKNNGVVIIFLANKKEGKLMASLRFITPLGVDLMSKLGMSLDDDKAANIPYQVCGGAGCVVAVEAKDEFIDKVKDATTMHVSYQAAGEGTVKLDASLKGFTKAFDALVKASSK